MVGKLKHINVDILDMKKELKELSLVYDYKLVDKAMKSLPRLLKQDFSIETKGSLIRDYIKTGPNKYLELNIWGHGLQNDKPVEIIGEAKSQLKKKDVDKFLQTLQMLQPLIDKQIVPLIVTYQTSPDVKRYFESKNVALYFSYQL